MKSGVTAFRALVLGVFGFGVMAGAAEAGPRDDVLSTLQRCYAIPNDRSWLDCYYGAAQSLRAQLGLPPAPAAQVAMVPPAGTYVPPPMAQATRSAPSANAVAPSGPPPMPRHSGGLLGGMFGGGKPVVNNLRMTSYDFSKDDRFTVTLADGEVWQQIAGDDSHANWRGPASRYIVNVYNGAAGTFNLQVSDDANLYKARRIR
jgi:hypothetical protein